MSLTTAKRPLLFFFFFSFIAFDWLEKFTALWPWKCHRFDHSNKDRKSPSDSRQRSRRKLQTLSSIIFELLIGYVRQAPFTEGHPPVSGTIFASNRSPPLFLLIFSNSFTLASSATRKFVLQRRFLCFYFCFLIKISNLFCLVGLNSYAFDIFDSFPRNFKLKYLEQHWKQNQTKFNCFWIS